MGSTRGLRTRHESQSRVGFLSSQFQIVKWPLGVVALLAAGLATAADVDEIVESALEADYASRTARAALEEARATVWRQRSTLLPMVALQADAAVNEHEISFDPLSILPDDLSTLLGDGSGAVVVQPKEVFSATLVAKTPILDVQGWQMGGVAVMLMRAKAANVERVEREVVIKALSVASSLVLARDAYGVAMEQWEQLLRLVTRAEKEQEAGLISRRDLLSVKLRSSEAAEDVAHAVQARTAAQSRFATVTGLDDDEEVNWSIGTLDEMPSLEVALRRSEERPIVRASALELSAAKRGESSARASFLPTASASFTWTAASEVAFSDDRSFWTGRVTTQWPLFTAGARVAENRIASSRMRMASVQLEGVKSQVSLEVQVAHDALSVHARALETAHLALELSAESLALVRNGESLGASHDVDVGLERVRHMGAKHRVRVAEHKLQLSQVSFLVYSGASIDLFKRRPSVQEKQ
jgi:outer membrane protein TolC